MESIPNARVAGGSGSGASSSTGDIVDTPTVIDGEDGMTSSSEGVGAQLAPGFGGEPKIPGMEPIPDALVQERCCGITAKFKERKGGDSHHFTIWRVSRVCSTASYSCRLRE
jgi:hypothetical protein